MSYINNVKKLYINIFFHNLIFAYVIERLFWEQRGMTILMVVYTEIIYAITIMLLEIPTGIIADKWSRKKMMVISAFITCISSFLIIYANNFWHFAALVFLSGISTSVTSGSENALLYDSLKIVGKERDFEKILGRMRAFDFSAALLAALSGAFLANKFGLEFNYWLSLISTIIAFGATVTLVDTKQVHTSSDQISIKEYVCKSLQVFKDSKALRIAIMSGMLLAAMLTYLDEFWQIYLNRLSIPILYFGIFSALFSFAKIPGGLLVSKLSNRFKFKQILSVNILVYAFGLIFIVVFKNPIGIIALVLVHLVSGITEPLVTSYLHHRIDSQMRATIDSFQSLGLRFTTVIIGLVFGYISTKLSIFYGFGVLGIVSLIYFCWFKIFTQKTEL